MHTICIFSGSLLINFDVAVIICTNVMFTL